MGVADLDVASLRGISHEKSNSRQRNRKSGEALSAGGHKTSFHDRRARSRVAQTGCGEIRPNLRRAIRGGRVDRKPICLGQRYDFACFHFGGKSRQGDHGCSEEREDRHC
jgi:hypothetical protein